MALTIELDFDGYWREEKKAGVPAKSGIYCVYTCTYNKNEGTVSIKKLVYIGEAKDVKNRLEKHDRLGDWKKHLNEGEVLCYSFAPKADPRNRAEAALIYKHQPPENVEYKDSFPFQDTRIKTSGQNKFLSADFTVKDTRQRGLSL